MKALFFTEGGGSKGFGHIARSFALAQAFQEEGVGTKLFIRGGVDPDHPLLREVKAQGELVLQDWVSEPERVYDDMVAADVAVVDSYDVSSSFFQAASDLVSCPVFLDDIGREDYPHGIIVNGCLYAEEKLPDVSGGHEFLYGGQYAILRRPFWNVPERVVRVKVETVLLSLGGGEWGELLPLLAEQVRAEFGEQVRIKVVLGQEPATKLRDRLERSISAEINVAPGAEEMCGLMAMADLAISAAGQTLYELARLGVPTIAFGVADNQAANLKAWERAGFIDNIGMQQERDRLLSHLKEALKNNISQEVRNKKSRAGQREVDGKGGRRIVTATMEYNPLGANPSIDQVRLRRTLPEDMLPFFKWANDTAVRQFSFNCSWIPYEDHRRWFSQKQKEAGVFFYTFILKGLPVGNIRLQEAEEGYVISIAFDALIRGRGWGASLLGKAVEQFRKEEGIEDAVIGEVKQDNVASVKMFQKAGFQATDPSSDPLIFVHSFHSGS